MGKITTTPTGYPHITRDQSGVLRIDDTGYKVIVLLAGYAGQQISAAAFHEHHPDLTKAQLHALLAYYYDHQAEIDEEIGRRQVEAERIRADMETSNPEFYARLREKLARASEPLEAPTAPT